jgi:glutathione S-transferase
LANAERQEGDDPSRRAGHSVAGQAHDIGKGEQSRNEFIAISPNNRMPAIVDNAPRSGGSPISVFESGVILFYLADKESRFWLQKDERVRYEVTDAAVPARSAR